MRDCIHWHKRLSVFTSNKWLCIRRGGNFFTSYSMLLDCWFSSSYYVHLSQKEKEKDPGVKPKQGNGNGATPKGDVFHD